MHILPVLFCCYHVPYYIVQTVNRKVQRIRSWSLVYLCMCILWHLSNNRCTIELKLGIRTTLSSNQRNAGSVGGSVCVLLFDNIFILLFWLWHSHTQTWLRWCCVHVCIQCARSPFTHGLAHIHTHTCLAPGPSRGVCRKSKYFYFIYLYKSITLVN